MGILNTEKARVSINGAIIEYECGFTIDSYIKTIKINAMFNIDNEYLRVHDDLIRFTGRPFDVEITPSVFSGRCTLKNYHIISEMDDIVRCEIIFEYV
jgi:hypothetical protein